MIPAQRHYVIQSLNRLTGLSRYLDLAELRTVGYGYRCRIIKVRFLNGRIPEFQ